MFRSPTARLPAISLDILFVTQPYWQADACCRPLAGSPALPDLPTRIAQFLPGLDAGLAQVVALSLAVSLVATGAASLIGLPLGAILAMGRFPGRRTLVVLANALLGLPPVVVRLGLSTARSEENAGGTDTSNNRWQTTARLARS